MPSILTMQHPPVRTRSAEAMHAQSSWIEGSPEAAELEQHASQGCSTCARALVNTREATVDLALAEATVAPREGGKRALLDRVRGKLGARRTTFLFQAGPVKQRTLDPAAVVAHKHIADPADVARVAEIDALRAAELRPGDGSARMLSQLARFLDFSVFFISIVRGERATYRAQRGLPETLSAFRELRREMSYCTHCISSDAPFIVENALTEPFFRGNKAATRFGVAAYAGVPLRMTSGIVIGTLCALDFSPRSIPVETTALIEVFARRAVALIERERTPSLLADVVEASSEMADLHTAPWLRDLLAVELSRATSRGRSALITLKTKADPRVVLSLLDEHETAGRLDEGAFGILLPNVGADAVALRVARLRDAAKDVTVGSALAPSGSFTAADWIASALR